ncbi:hypothetical protein EKO27_g6398 [Xylaria grammica]|uniref:Tat pathway signal sequence n=1 Tax=Xylaria grammica TaxID=363999 RepID=A0A439D2Q1_9PEZI|nr:hypothetical protein EKO27_g6398 [Xylaria grammica]
MFSKRPPDHSYVASPGELSPTDEESRGFINDKGLCCDTCHRPYELESKGWPFISRYAVFISWTIAAISLGFFFPPLFEDGAIEYRPITYNNLFGAEIELGGPPTIELEHKWLNLWSHGNIELQREEIRKLGKSTEGLLHAGGNNPKRGYVANLEVFHYLHCLNQIRQFTYKEHYATHMAEWIEKDHRSIVDLNVTDPNNALDRMHVDHCIDALRQQLMCSANVVPLLVEVDEGSKLGYKTDFNVNMKCRNYDKILEWQYAHALLDD